MPWQVTKSSNKNKFGLALQEDLDAFTDLMNMVNFKSRKSVSGNRAGGEKVGADDAVVGVPAAAAE